MTKFSFVTLCLVWSALLPSAISFASQEDVSCTLVPRSERCPRNHGLRLPIAGDGKARGPIKHFGIGETAGDARARARNQYPVNVFMEFPEEIGLGLQIRIEPHPNGTWLNNDGNTIDVPADGALSIFDTPYRLVRFLFHMPSKNRTLGKPLVMKWHFVFKGLKREDRDKLAFVNITVGTSDSILEEMGPGAADDVKRKTHAALSAPLRWCWANTFVNDHSRLQHTGSLTSPACASGVSWFAVDDKHTPHVDDLTYEWIEKAVERGARPAYRASLPEKCAVIAVRGAWRLAQAARELLRYAVCGTLAGMAMAKLGSLWVAIWCCYLAWLLEDEMLGLDEAASRRRARWEKRTADLAGLTALEWASCVEDEINTII